MLAFLLVSAAYGQRLTFGVIGGTNLTSNFPVTDYLTPADAFGNPASRFQYLTGKRSLILGGLVEWRFTDRFSIEVNVLERPMNARIVFTEFLSGGVTRISDNRFSAVRAWEFPAMLKYRLPSWRYGLGLVRPFVEAGPSLRTQENASSTEPSRFGVSVGAGAAFQAGPIRIAPTLRYTRWERELIAPKYATKPDQVEFLTSITYQTEAGSLRLGGRRVELGLVAGLSPTPAFRQVDLGDAESERARYLAGLTVQWRATENLAVEADGIYKPLRVSSDESTRGTLFSVLTWQIPVLAKYGWTRVRWRPFAEAGPSFRLAGNLNGYNPSHYGVTAGGGVEARVHGLAIAPALRYTRWAGDASRYGGGGRFDYPRTQANAVELLVGISF